MIRGETGQRGAAAVEFGLLLPVLLLILFGTIEYGWFLTTQFVLNNAVSQGARAGIKAKTWEDEDPAEIARTAVKSSFWLIGETDPQSFDQMISARVKEGDSEPKALEVKVVDFEYQQITGFIPDKLIPQYLGAKAVMAFP